MSLEPSSSLTATARVTELLTPKPRQDLHGAECGRSLRRRRTTGMVPTEPATSCGEAKSCVDMAKHQRPAINQVLCYLRHLREGYFQLALLHAVTDLRNSRDVGNARL